jgi:bifunctional ADP-heptose synthase (sugar kinase/adenylyltransferase)
LREVVGRWHDDEELARKAEALRASLRLEALLVTRSEEGMSLFHAGGALHEQAVAREVFDVSGAGDTVIATLAVMLAGGPAGRRRCMRRTSPPAWWLASSVRRWSAATSWMPH